MPILSFFLFANPVFACDYAPGTAPKPPIQTIQLPSTYYGLDIYTNSVQLIDLREDSWTTCGPNIIFELSKSAILTGVIGAILFILVALILIIKFKKPKSKI